MSTHSLTPPVTKRDHLRGSVAAPITLVQFGDYACPYCTEAHPIVRKLMEVTNGQMRFVYRHYPTVSDLSRPAAETTEAAADVDAFWDIHDLLSVTGGKMTKENLLEAAAASGLNKEELTSNLEHGVFAEQVEKDLESAKKSGVEGTPAFFINGEPYQEELGAASILRRMQFATRRQGAITRAYMRRLENVIGRAGLM